MRSCDFLIFEAATISIALVIFFVPSTLLILTRISFPAAMRKSSFWSWVAAPSGEGLLERGHSARQLHLGVLVELPALLDLGEQARVAGLEVRVQAGFEGEHLLDVDVVHEPLVDGEQRRRHQRDRERRVLRLLEQLGDAGTSR